MNEERNERINENKTNEKLHELTEEELAQVFGGNSKKCDGCEYNSNGACRTYGMMGTQCPHGYA